MFWKIVLVIACTSWTYGLITEDLGIIGTSTLIVWMLMKAIEEIFDD